MSLLGSCSDWNNSPSSTPAYSSGFMSHRRWAWFAHLQRAEHAEERRRWRNLTSSGTCKRRAVRTSAAPRSWPATPSRAGRGDAARATRACRAASLPTCEKQRLSHLTRATGNRSLSAPWLSSEAGNHPVRMPRAWSQTSPPSMTRSGQARGILLLKS